MRTLTATNVRATSTGPESVSLIVEARDTEDGEELFELVLGQRVLVQTMRDVLGVMLDTWPL